MRSIYLRMLGRLAIWWCLVIAGTNYGATPSLQPLGFTNGQFRLRVNTEEGKDYLVEGTTNLVDWATELEQPFPGTFFEFLERSNIGGPRKFFRAREVVLSGLKPSEVEVSSGDQLLFLMDVAGPETNWRYSVNGSIGGNTAVGLIQSTTNNSRQALFTAPVVSVPIDVQVCATDPNDTNRVYCATVKVLPPATILEVRPGNSDVALGGQLNFKAGGVVNGFFIELRQVYWKVNGQIGGNSNLGIVDSNGRYRAPTKMPTNVPVRIEVGFSLTPEGALQASSEIDLVRLVVNPPVVRSFTINASAFLTVELQRSSRTNLSPIPSADVTIVSDRITSARVSVCCPNSGNTFGSVTFGEVEGRATIKAEHKRNGAVGSAFAEARATPVMRLKEIDKITDDKISITRTGSTEQISRLEVTRPGVKLKLLPDIFFFRGQAVVTNAFVGMSGSTNLIIRGDGSNVVDYARERVAHTAGLVATVERQTGIITFGDRPGTGTVTYVYYDGFIGRTTGVTLVHSAVGISATFRPYSFGSDLTNTYITEPIEAFISITNKSRTGFVGKTPVKITLAGEPIRAAVLKKEDFTEQSYNLQETEQLLLYDEGTQSDNVEQILYGVRFQIYPRRAGEHRFRIEVPNNPLVAPVEIVANVKRPQLRVGGNTNSPIAVNSYLNIVHANGVPVTSALFLPRNALMDKLVWTIRSPSGATNKMAYDGIRFPGVLNEDGTYYVSLSYDNRPEISTEELPVELKPHSFTDFEAIRNTPLRAITDSRGISIPRENQFAGLTIVAPTGGSWVPGVPITILLQCYAGDGVARQIGKKTVTVRRFTSSPGFADITTNYVIGGILSLTNSAKIIPNNSGVIQYNYMPEATLAGAQNQDILRNFTVQMHSFTGNEIPDQPNLPVEYFEYEDGVLVTQQQVATGLAQFVNEFDSTLRNPTLMIPGRGIVADPTYVAVPSRRVREAVEEGILPAGSEHIKVTLLGTAGFMRSLDSGVVNINVGEGLSVISQTISNGRLHLTLNSDISFFELDHNRYTSREITFGFGNGSTGKTTVNLVGYRVSTNRFQADYNLPLNAAYGYRQGTSIGRASQGSVELDVQPIRQDLPLLRYQMELRPSIHACWDSNLNGDAEPDEDRHPDGKLDERDNFAGVPYRGVMPINPIVGFDREKDPDTGQVFVRGLKRDLVADGRKCSFVIYGDTTDLRRLNRETRVLSALGNSDDLPDFTSREANAEAVMCSIGGNIADLIRFTAYNFVAEMTKNIPDPGITFTNLQHSMALAYEKYSEVDPDATIEGNNGIQQIRSGVSIYVDHEADPTFFRAEGDYLYGYIPQQYYAGILDQFYQRTLRSAGYGYYTTAQPVGRDRVRGYDRPHERLVTGVNRTFFGIDLDGVFYDPGWMDFPKARHWDPGIIHALSQINVVDENPNSPALLNIPVLDDVLDSTLLTESGLIARAGGTSGGYVDLDRYHVGSLKVEAKTPGAELPGLHAGYLVLGKPDELIDPRNSLVEDDIRDVLIKRGENEDGESVGEKIEQEPLFLSTPAPRYVNGFAWNEDKAWPIFTSARVNYSFRVQTDPEGVMPQDTNTWKFSPGISIREKQVPDDLEMDLIVATQSDGDEKTIKFLADTVVDIIAKVLAGAIQNTIDKAMKGKLCDFQADDDFFYLGFEAALNGFADTEVFQSFMDQERSEVQRKVLSVVPKAVHEGFTSPLIPGVTMPGALKLIETYNQPTIKMRLDNLRKEVFTPCDLLTSPIERIADRIKQTYSAETFGGLGSAEAVGTRLVTLAIPASAHLTNGLFSMSFSFTRKIDIQPTENEMIDLFDLPYDEVFGDYPYADEVSDDEFFATLLELRNDDEVGEAATQILRALGRKSILRVPRNNLYSHYKVRAWKVPGLDGFVAPGMFINSGLRFGKFALSPGEEIPVSSAAVVSAGKSNENAAARARLTSPGYDMVFLNSVIMIQLPE